MKKPLKAKKDKLIEMLLLDENYKIEMDGRVLTRITRTGKVSAKNEWRVAGYEHNHRGKSYFYMKYKGTDVKIHRIVYAKFNGALDQKKVVNHKDGNGLNNHPTNLELVTWSYNSAYRGEE